MQLRTTAGCIAGTVFALAASIGLPAGAAAAASRAPTLRAVHFADSFVPQQIVAAAGRLWVLGSRQPSSFTDCALREVDPSTMMTNSFALPECATGMTSGNGRVYMLVNQTQPGTDERDYQIEVFDPATDAAQVLAPVVLQNIGSAVAHTDVSFGAGSLWLYGYANASPEVVQISPQTGAVERTIHNPPQIGGVFPAVVADRAGVWLGGGPGGPPQLEWVRGGTDADTNLSLVSGGRTGSILWLSAVAGRIWAGVATYGRAPGTTTVSTRLVALTDDGRASVRSPSEPVGLFPVVATPDGRLWDVVDAKTCGDPERLLEINPSTGVAHATASLVRPPGACDDEDGGSELATIGRRVFVLFPAGQADEAVLYRATT